MPWHLLRADPHRYGPGKVHILQDGRTRCGKERSACPGQEELCDDGLDFVDCKGCLNSLEAQRRREEREHEGQRQRAERQARWEDEQRLERERYNAYLWSPEWRDRRARVMQRAGTLCEGCLEQRATQVHHLTYERKYREMLFDLVAVCDNCHAEIHPHLRGAA
jgi:hypothetical protein